MTQENFNALIVGFPFFVGMGGLILYWLSIEVSTIIRKSKWYHKLYHIVFK